MQQIVIRDFKKLDSTLSCTLSQYSSHAYFRAKTLLSLNNDDRCLWVGYDCFGSE